MHYYGSSVKAISFCIQFLVAIFLILATFTNAGKAKVVLELQQPVNVHRIVGPTGPTGDTGPTGPDGSDGIGLHLRKFIIGEKYSPGQYVFSRAPNHKHDAMFVAQKHFVAKDIPANELSLNHWVELSKGEKGEPGPTGATGEAGSTNATTVDIENKVRKELLKCYA